MPGPEVREVRRAAVALVADEEGGDQTPVGIGVKTDSGREPAERCRRQRWNPGRQHLAGLFYRDKIRSHSRQHNFLYGRAGGGWQIDWHGRAASVDAPTRRCRQAPDLVTTGKVLLCSP